MFDNRQTPRMSHAFAQSDWQNGRATASRSKQKTSSHFTQKFAMPTYSSRSPMGMSVAKEFKLHELAMLSIAPIIRSIQQWWFQRAEQHYLMCAEVEEQRAREAQMNVAYYQKRAALARAAKH